MNLDWSILIQYIIYAAVIVVGIAALLLLRKAEKLPTHRKLYERMQALLEEAEAFSAAVREQEEKLRFFKRISKLLYGTDKLIHASSALARKERDMDIDNVSVLLERVRSALLPYKYGHRGKNEPEGLACACDGLREAIAVMENVLARDDQLRARSGK